MKPAYKWGLLGCLGCLTPVVWVVLTLVISKAFPDHPIKWDWEATSAAPVPANFMYIMFPASPNAAVYDRPNGKAVGILDRAMMNSEAERTDVWVRLVSVPPAADLWVRREDLTFDPPPSQVALVSAASANYKARKADIFAHLRFTPTQSATSADMLLEVRPDDDHAEDYKYSVTNGIATPLKMRRYFGPAVALQSLEDLPVAGLIAAAVLVIPVVSYRIVKRVRDRRRAFAQARSNAGSPVA